MKHNQLPYQKTEMANVFSQAAFMFFFIAFLQTSLITATFGQNISDLKTRIGELISSQDSRDREVGVRLNKLAYELNPTLFIKNGEIQPISDETPICCDIDAPFIAILYTDNSEFESIEYLSIRVSDLNSIQALDISRLISFKSLKFVHLIFQIECSTEFINNLATTEGSGIKLFYSIQIPQ